MIMAGDTGLANAAMFAARWLGQVTCLAVMAWMEQYPVVWISLHLVVVIVRRDE